MKYFVSLLFLAALGCCFADALAQTPKQKTVQLNTELINNPPSIRFQWQPISGSTGIQVFRKTKEGTSWGSPIASLTGSDTIFTDNSIAKGIPYEYRIYSTGSIPANTYLLSGIELSPVEYRGKIILLVDSLFIDSLAVQIERLENDIRGDGWQLVRYDISRNQTPPFVKNLIVAEYDNAPTDVKAVFLLGHIPVPYSGKINPDGHPDHLGAWPADGYYGDMTTVFTDVSVFDTSASRLKNRNIPGDGKFDQNVLSTDVKLQIGRVDFWGLPQFTASEIELMRRYLDKNHDYRQKVFVAERRALIDDNFGYFSGEAFSSGAWRNFNSMFPTTEIITGDYFTDMDTNSFLWSYGCGAGSYTNCNGVGNTAAFANNKPKTVFTMLFGSYFGDWDSNNNLLRATLASEGWSLACSWSGRPQHIYHHMALGENIGYSMRISMGNAGLYESGNCARYVSTALMGDPTLRMHTIAPPSGFSVSYSQSLVSMIWSPSPDSVLGYYVYRKDKSTGIYQRINSDIITSPSYTDSFPVNAMNQYMLRAVKLELSNSGSYFNQSQGVFDSVLTDVSLETHSPLISGLNAYPNPAQSQVTLNLSVHNPGNIDVCLFDLSGAFKMRYRVGHCQVGRQSFSFAISELSGGVYVCRIDVDGIPAAHTKIIVVR